jgi:ribosomal protein L11 methylase PrmA
VVTAHLVADVIIAMRGCILRALAPGGTLLTSGIIDPGRGRPGGA